MKEVTGIKIMHAHDEGWQVMIYTQTNHIQESQSFYLSYKDRAELAKLYSDIGTMLTSPQNSGGWFRKWRSDK